jgi:hypothetical protein
MKLKLASMVAGLLLAAGPVIAMAPDPFMGTWVFNAAKSKYLGAPMPKSLTAVYAAVGSGLHVTANGTNAQGQPTHVEYTANFDAKDYPVDGSPDYDMVSLKRLSSNRITFIRKQSGVKVQWGTITVSTDGKTRTVVTDGRGPGGTKMHTVGVFDKQ